MKTISLLLARLDHFLNLRKALLKGFLERKWVITLLFLVVTETIRIVKGAVFRYTGALAMQ